MKKPNNPKSITPANTPGANPSITRRTFINRTTVAGVATVFALAAPRVALAGVVEWQVTKKILKFKEGVGNPFTAENSEIFGILPIGYGMQDVVDSLLNSYTKNGWENYFEVEEIGEWMDIETQEFDDEGFPKIDCTPATLNIQVTDWIEPGPQPWPCKRWTLKMFPGPGVPITITLGKVVNK